MTSLKNLPPFHLLARIRRTLDEMYEGLDERAGVRDAPTSPPPSTPVGRSGSFEDLSSPGLADQRVG